MNDGDIRLPIVRHREAMEQIQDELTHLQNMVKAMWTVGMHDTARRIEPSIRLMKNSLDELKVAMSDQFVQYTSAVEQGSQNMVNAALAMTHTERKDASSDG
jgi:hypothetical protein